MELKSSYGVKILGRTLAPAIKATITIYREALAYLIEFLYGRWDDIMMFGTATTRFNYAEGLIHTSGSNRAVCDFDQKFHKMPSYFRRACLKYAIGCVSSYMSNHQNWVDGGRQGAEPKLTAERYACPTFYYDNMYTHAKDGSPAKIKLFDGRDWVWMELNLSRTDLKYISAHFCGEHMSAPTLEKKRGVYYLRFLIKEKIELSARPLEEQTICSVDLGVNMDAVCSIMDMAGTVLARKFINFPSEKDQLYRVLNRIKALQRRYGSKNGAVKNEWAYAARLNDELAKHISHAVFEVALEYNVDCIVFEFLNMKGRLHGSKKQRVSMWKRNSIQKYVEHKAHRAGMHVSHVCAWGTSALAFDGSGRIIRGRKNLCKKEILALIPLLGKKTPLPKDGRPETYTNKETCTFQNGKEYNCDLNASYNIGARYFIRALLAKMTDEDRAEIFEQVPDAEKAPTRTLNTLKTLLGFYKRPAARAAGAW
ncbi:MAG: transposase [Clostridiales bacterium]|nr:transposase [Clostridiales bacterium]